MDEEALIERIKSMLDHPEGSLLTPVIQDCLALAGRRCKGEWQLYFELQLLGIKEGEDLRGRPRNWKGDPGELEWQPAIAFEQDRRNSDGTIVCMALEAMETFAARFEEAAEEPISHPLFRDSADIPLSYQLDATRTRENAKGTALAIRSQIGKVRTRARQFLAEIETESTAAVASGGLQRIQSICGRFHLVARRLRERYDQRPTLDVADEYDVQDLLHALLALDFDDIRREEWTPSYAGGSARMDFLIRELKAVIEVKKTRRTLREREVGDQLLIDIARYQSHPDCQRLICFVYDPEGLIGNPAGLEEDLSRPADPEVRVIVAPRGV